MSSGLAIKRMILSRDAARFIFSRYRLHSSHRMFRANSRIDEAIAAGSAGLRRRDSILREIRSFRLRGSRFCAVASSKTAVPKVWPAIPRLAPLSMAPTTALKNAARPMIRQAAVSAYLVRRWSLPHQYSSGHLASSTWNKQTGTVRAEVCIPVVDCGFENVATC
jgi:hypothetical protein